MSGWQPIETAPMDEPIILGCDCPFESWASEGLWVRGDGPGEGFWSVLNDHVPAWVPTHWQPFPAPPARQEKAA